MNEHIFSCFHEGASQTQFTKTCEALAEYVARNFKNSGDMMSIAKELKAPDVKKPAQIDKNETDLLTLAVWKKQVGNCVAARTSGAKLKSTVLHHLGAVQRIHEGQAKVLNGVQGHQQ